MRLRALLVMLVLVVVLLARDARGDALVVSRAARATTVAEIFVEPDGIRVELEIGASDVGAFRNLMPDEVYERIAEESRPAGERVPEFFAQDLVIAPEGGAPMAGGIVEIGPEERVVRDLITGEPLPPENEPEIVIRAVLRYLWDERPDAISIGLTPRHGSAEVGFVAYHEGVAVNDFRYLPDTVTLDLDWTDPWYSAFRTRTLRRQLYAPLHGFLYVDPYEVRKEVIARPKDLQRFTDLGLAGSDVIRADAQPEMLRKIAEFLRPRLRVVIDGETIEPELLRANFLRRTLKASTVVDPPEDLRAISATVGVIFAYPVPAMPQRATMEWDLFDERITMVPVSSVDPAGPFPSQVTPDDPVLEWVNYLKFDPLPQMAVVSEAPTAVERTAVWLRWALAAASLLWLIVTLRRGEAGRRVAPLAGLALCVALTAGAFVAGRAARLGDESASDVVGGLLHNVYRSFDFREEEQVYDLLAESVHGELLTDTYLETRRSLEVRNQGGARVRVKALEIVEIDVEPDGDGFGARTRWNVSGSVGHWGHVHTRTNQYLANVTVRPVEDPRRGTALALIGQCSPHRGHLIGRIVAGVTTSRSPPERSLRHAVGQGREVGLLEGRSPRQAVDVDLVEVQVHVGADESV
jgi:hypothetical protein